MSTRCGDPGGAAEAQPADGPGIAGRAVELYV
jgi:hypothetical protein